MPVCVFSNDWNFIQLEEIEMNCLLYVRLVGSDQTAPSLIHHCLASIRISLKGPIFLHSAILVKDWVCSIEQNILTMKQLNTDRERELCLARTLAGVLYCPRLSRNDWRWQGEAWGVATSPLHSWSSSASQGLPVSDTQLYLTLTQKLDLHGNDSH